VERKGVLPDRNNADPQLMEPNAHVVVFAAPAAVVFIEAVDRLDILPPGRKIAAQESRLMGMTQAVVEKGFPMGNSQAAPLGAGEPSRELPGKNLFLAAGRAGFAIPANRVRGQGQTRPAEAEMGRQVVGGDQAVAVQKKDVGGRRGGDAFVASPSGLESLVRVRAEADRHPRLAPESLDDLGGLVLGAVVRHDQLDLVRGVALGAHRQQA